MTNFIRPPADTTTGKRINAALSNDGTNDIYTQVIHLGDSENPDQHQAVDNQGAAVVRFSDGSPEFDIFGRLTVSEPNLMGAYKFYEREYADEFMKTEVGTGAVSHDLANRGMKLTCGTAAGDVASYMSHRFYNYRPMNDMPLTFTMTSSPAVVGRTREVGWYSNGGDKMLFEEVDGNMNVLIYDALSSITTRIPNTAWSHDRLDGSGSSLNKSGVTLDATKGSIWYISFQYLSMGIVEFGQLIDGVKTLCHRVNHYNLLDRPYMASASMSFGFTQTNTAICGSAGTMLIHCATITNDGYDDFIHSQAVAEGKATVSGTSWTPIVSFQPSQLTAIGDANRSRVLPLMISVLSKTSNIELRTDKNPALTGDTFARSSGRVDFDDAATAVAVTDDTRIFGRVVGSGISDNVPLADVIRENRAGVTRHHNAATSNYLTISARLIEDTDPATLVSVVATLRAIE